MDTSRTVIICRANNNEVKNMTVEFLRRKQGRIGVYTKTNNTELDVEDMCRLGTITYSPTLKQHLFYQGVFGMGTKLCTDNMFQISIKLKKLDDTWQ